MQQLDLALIGGHHIGSLFVPQKVRPAKPRVDSSKRDRLLRRRTPAWADKRAIRWHYAQARSITRFMGEKWSVDHIVPLHHPLVCGLHVDNNLREIPLKSNLSRGNNDWWPDAPFEQGELL